MTVRTRPAPRARGSRARLSAGGREVTWRAPSGGGGTPYKSDSVAGRRVESVSRPRSCAEALAAPRGTSRSACEGEEAPGALQPDGRVDAQAHLLGRHHLCRRPLLPPPPPCPPPTVP